MSDSQNTDLRALFQSDTPSLESVVNETRARMDPAATERNELTERLRRGVAQNENQPLTDLAGIVGLACILLGLASMAFTTGVHIASLGLVGIGVALEGIYVATNQAAVKRFLTNRATIYSANMSITVGIFLAILVVVNLLANRYYSSWDLTAEQLNSLSPQSIELLGTLRESGREISITAFYPKDAAHKDAIRVLETVFGRYTHENPHLKFSIIDPDVNAKLAQDKGITVPGTILFEAGDNSARINSLTEGSITGGLLKVTNPDSKLVYFIVGHNEFSVNDVNGRGLKKLSDELGNENLVVKELSIPREGKIPADAAAVILVRPSQTPLQVQELEALDDYLARGGNVMVLLEPFQAPEVVAWLKGYGLEARSDMVIDVEANEFNEATVPILAPAASEHPLLPQELAATATVLAQDLGLVTPNARSLNITQGKANWTPLYATETLLSFGETDQNAALPGFTEGEDNQGPVTVVAAGQLPVGEGEQGGRLIVAGDADWVTNDQLPKAHNHDFGVNAVDWLVGSEEQIAIRPKLPNLTKADLKGNALSVVAATVFGIPVLIAIGGVLVWWRRRTW